MKSLKEYTMEKAKKKAIELLVVIVVVRMDTFVTLRIIYRTVLFIGRTIFIRTAIRLKNYILGAHHFLKQKILLIISFIYIYSKYKYVICYCLMNKRRIDKLDIETILNVLIVRYTYYLIKNKVDSLLINLLDLINLIPDMILNFQNRLKYIYTYYL